MYLFYLNNNHTMIEGGHMKYFCYFILAFFALGYGVTFWEYMISPESKLLAAGINYSGTIVYGIPILYFLIYQCVKIHVEDKER